MGDISNPWADPEGLKRVKSLTPANIIELEKLKANRRSVHPLSYRRRVARLAPKKNALDKRAHSQAQSLFFRLPAELREVIYQRLLAFPRPLHIRYKGDQLVSWECTGDGSVFCGYRNVFCCQRPHTVFDDILTERRRRSWVIGLVGSCRRMYFEAIHYLYELNAFYIDHPETLRRFSQGLQFSSIRSLTVLAFANHHIHYRTQEAWPSSCSLFRRMRNPPTLRTPPRGAHWSSHWWMHVDNPHSLNPSPLLKALRGISISEYIGYCSLYILQWRGELDEYPELNEERWFCKYWVRFVFVGYESDADHWYHGAERF